MKKSMNTFYFPVEVDKKLDIVAERLDTSKADVVARVAMAGLTSACSTLLQSDEPEEVIESKSQLIKFELGKIGIREVSDGKG